MAETVELLSWDDVERVVKARAGNLVEVVQQFLKQPAPAVPRELAEDALTEKRVADALAKLRKELRPPAEKRPEREALFARWSTQTDPPPPLRLRLAELLLDLDQPEDPLARQAMLTLAKEAPLVWGPWLALKKAFKGAEARWDVELLAALAWRFDTVLADLRRRNQDTGEVKQATLAYLARRAWRFLRHVGQATPELYPSFAAEILQHYQDNTPWEQTWIANQIFYHRAPGATVHRIKKLWDPKKRKQVIKRIPRVKRIYDKKRFLGPFPGSVTQHRAFADAWTADSSPLFRLIEVARADRVLTFAIEILEKNFADELKQIAPEVLLRWGSRQNTRLHLFVVKLLKDNAAVLPPARYREVGLHSLMLAFLESPQAQVRTFAVEYARGYAQDLPIALLMKILREGQFDDVKRFVVESLARRRGADLGLPLLKDLLAIPLTNAMATKKLREDFDKSALSPAWLKDLLLSGQQPLWQFSQSYLDREYTPQELSASFYASILDDARLRDNLQKSQYSWLVRYALDRLATLPPEKLGLLGAQWVKDALVRPELRDAVQKWIATGVFPPRVLGVEYFQGLVFNESLVAYAFEVLKQDAFSPTEIGVSWCFGILRDERPWLHDKSADLLASRFQPSDFDPEGQAELARAFSALWRRATGEGAGEDRPWVRSFAQKYLMDHHPILAEREAAKETNPKAKTTPKTFPRALYDGERVLASVADIAPSQKDPSDTRKDVSFFAQTLARLELRRWLDEAKEQERQGIVARLFGLADHASGNVRRFAYAVLAGTEDDARGYKLSVKELCAYPEQVYALAESRYLGTRQLGEFLIGAYYDELGGSSRVLSLAESVERDVIDFAAKLLFHHHHLANTSGSWRATIPPVISRRAGMHEKPEAASLVVRELRPGRWLKLIEDQGDWFKVEDGGVTGFIKAKDARLRVVRPQPKGPEALSEKELLVEFFRRVLLRLPPGRRPQQKGQKGQKEAGSSPWAERFHSNRAVKRHVIELARDLALADKALAEPVADLLRPLVRSAVADEARASLGALVRISKAHQLPLRLEGLGENSFRADRRRAATPDN
jgi:hypothetical protein